jgi:anti-sigma regulatory factor (Ser/Thr protein kinase)
MMIVVGVVGLLIVVLISGPAPMWLALAVVAAAAAMLGARYVGSTAHASARNVSEPDPNAESSEPRSIGTVPVAPTGSVGPGRDAETVSKFVVSLARRNGGLVDQQLALLDVLEASVEDPTLLSNYFKLDHLATRMRRNADSLLVLAGVDRPGLRGPQDIDEVVRAGISEIEDYRRIDVLALDHVQVTGRAATTLGHLVAELLDNATEFSPSETRVRVAGNASATGYEIVVADSGIGIADVRLGVLNERLTRPPELGTTHDESIGLTVVSMLAARIGATVALSHSEPGGTVATVHIPSAVLHSGERHDSDLALPPMVDISTWPLDTPAPAAAAPAPATAAPAPAVPAMSSSLLDVDVSTASLQAASAAAIAKLTLTVAGLPVRTTPTITSDEFLPSRVRMPSLDPTSWPPPAGHPRADLDADAPASLHTVLGSLQVAESIERRPVVEAQPARIGAALTSFARQSVSAREPITAEGNPS